LLTGIQIASIFQSPIAKGNSSFPTLS